MADLSNAFPGFFIACFMNNSLVLMSLPLADDAPISPLRNPTAVWLGTYRIVLYALLSALCKLSNSELL